MLHGGGPGASAWSNFGSALPALRGVLPHPARRPARLRRLRQAAGGRQLLPLLGRARRRAARRARHRPGAPARQQPRRRYGDAAGARAPRPGRPAGADGARRALAQPVPRRPHRGRPAADGVRREPDPRGAARVHLDDGRQPGAGHRRAGRGAVRRRHRPRRAGGDALDGHVVLEPGDRRGRHALARGAQAPQAHAAHLGPRGPRQPARRRHGRAQADPARRPCTSSRTAGTGRRSRPPRSSPRSPPPSWPATSRERPRKAR